MTSADPLDEAGLRAALIRSGGIWQRLDVVAETGSTNADLAARARAGEAPGSVLITDFQSAGRGRRGRVWTAPPGSGIAMSVSVAPPVDPARWTWLPLLTGLAVASGLQQAADGLPELSLKWPNDVLADGQKLCGILAERVETATGPACVIGMGINVALTTDQLPVPTATSLQLLLGDHTPSRPRLIAAVLSQIEARLTEWLNDPAALKVAYRTRCSTLGRDVAVSLAADRIVEGAAVGLDPDGCLIVSTSTGRVVVGAGDVVHVR